MNSMLRDMSRVLAMSSAMENTAVLEKDIVKAVQHIVETSSHFFTVETLTGLKTSCDSACGGCTMIIFFRSSLDLGSTIMLIICNGEGISSLILDNMAEQLLLDTWNQNYFPL
jgi:hypothetical protein